MRKIKFRAWNGYRIIKDEIHRIQFYRNGHWSIIGMEKFNGVNNLKREYKIASSYRPDNKAVIMQYTGLKDKNGVEIYEGDIVRATFGKHSKLNEYGEWTGKIFFNCGSFDIDGEWCVALNALGDTTFEVIGNIYQNAELLE